MAVGVVLVNLELELLILLAGPVLRLLLVLALLVADHERVGLVALLLDLD